MRSWLQPRFAQKPCQLRDVCELERHEPRLPAAPVSEDSDLPARVARHQRNHRGEVAARAIAADGDLFCIYFQ